MPRLVSLVVFGLLGLCLVSDPAEARELSKGERAYSRALGKLLDLKPKGTKALTSKSGAQGVQVRFLGLDVTRLHFRSAQAARGFAKRRSREKSGRQRVALKGQEIVVLRGPRLSNLGFAKRAVKASWEASLRSPSKPTKGGILGPLDAQEAEEAKEAKEKAASAELVAKAKRGRLAKPKAPGLPTQEPVTPKIGELPTVGEVTRVRAGMPSINLDSGPASTRPSGPKAPARRRRGLDVDGVWETLGRGRITFRHNGYTKTAELYEVLCVDFDRPCPPLVGTLIGRRLTLRAAGGKGHPVTYLWTPGKVGARFVRVSGPRDLLPRGTNAFWRAPKK